MAYREIKLEINIKKVSFGRNNKKVRLIYLTNQIPMYVYAWLLNTSLLKYYNIVLHFSVVLVINTQYL